MFLLENGRSYIISSRVAALTCITKEMVHLVRENIINVAQNKGRRIKCDNEMEKGLYECEHIQVTRYETLHSQPCKNELLFFIVNISSRNDAFLKTRFANEL